PPKEPIEPSAVESSKFDFVSNILLMLQSGYKEGEVPQFLKDFISEFESRLNSNPDLRALMDKRAEAIEKEISKLSPFEQKRAETFAKMGRGKQILASSGWSFSTYLTAKVLADAIQGIALSDDASLERIQHLFSSKGFKEEVLTYIGFAGTAAIVRAGQMLTFQQTMRYLTQHYADKAFNEMVLLKQSVYLDKALRLAMTYGGRQLGGELSKIISSGVKEAFPMFLGMMVSSLITAYMQHPDWVLLDNSDLDKEEKSQIRSKILYESTITTSQKLAFWASIGVNTAEFATAMTVIKGGVCLAKHCVAGAKWISAVPEGAALAPAGPLPWAAGFLIETGELASAMVLAHLFDKVVDPLSGSLIAWLDETDIQRQAQNENMRPKIIKYLSQIAEASEFKHQHESKEACLAGLDSRIQTLAEKSEKQRKLEEQIEKNIHTLIQKKLLKIGMAMRTDANFHRIHNVYEKMKNGEYDLPFESRIKRYDQIFIVLDKLDARSQMEKMNEIERIQQFVQNPKGIRVLPSDSPFNFSFEAIIKPEEPSLFSTQVPKSSSEREFWMATYPSSFVVEMKQELDLLNQKLFNEHSMCMGENTKDEWTPFNKMEQDFNFIGKALFDNQGFKRVFESQQATDKTIQAWFSDDARLNAFKGLLQHEQAALLHVNQVLKPRKGEKKLPKKKGSISWFAKTRIAQINSQLESSNDDLGKTLSEELYYKERPGNEATVLYNEKEAPEPQPRYIPEPPHRQPIPRRPGTE
ncbi:MAG: hypothetical protein HY559_02695, partial [Gammaproteobacteria bacterium]|nr:hypothetical protein [Gammaproteobacteria bacterium]